MIDPVLHYGQIAEAMRSVERGLRQWASTHLKLAGIEGLPVLSDFQLSGGAAMVLFPYQVGPDPSLRERSLVYNLLQISYPWVQGTVTDARGKNLPPAWNALGLALAQALELLLALAGAPDLVRPTRQPLNRGVFFDPDTLPLPLRRWFERPADEGALRWRRELIVMRGEHKAYLNPYVGWQTGYTIGVNHLAMIDLWGDSAREPHQGSALPALAVLIGSIHRERLMRVELPPRPIPPELLGYLEAVRDSLPEKSPERLAMADAVRRIQLPEMTDLALDPVQDLNDETVSLVMRAVQRPLRPYINLRVRVRLGDGPEIGASPSPDLANNLEVSSGSERARSAAAPDAQDKPVGFGGKRPEKTWDTPRKMETYDDFQTRAREEQARQLAELREHPLYGDLPSGPPEEEPS